MTFDGWHAPNDVDGQGHIVLLPWLLSYHDPDPSAQTTAETVFLHCQLTRVRFSMCDLGMHTLPSQTPVTVRCMSCLLASGPRF